MLTDIKVVGITSQQEFFVGSKEKNFRINEFLKISDPDQGDLIGEVVEARTLNRYIPLDMAGDFVDSSVLESLNALGFNIDDETIYIAKIRLIEEALYPVITGSDVSVPEFHEIKKYVINSSVEEGLVLGTVRNTDDMYDSMEEEYKGLVYTYEDSKLLNQKEIPYIMNLKSMHQYPHIGIFGGSGSGKSFGLRILLEEIMKHRVPTLVLDPHYEMDFSTMAEYFKEDMVRNYNNFFEKFEVGLDVGVNFEDLKPRDLKNLLSSVSSLTDSMDNVVDVMLQNNDSYLTFSTKLERYMKGVDAGGEAQLRQIINNSMGEEKEEWSDILEVFLRYEKRVAYPSARGIMWRLINLYNQGIFNHNIDPILDSIQTGKLVVLQGSQRILQTFGSYIIENMYYKRRNFKDAQYRRETEEYFPPFIIVTDEAHNFAPKGVVSTTRDTIKEIAQEGRKYGIFLALATQRPTLLDETVTAQLNTKMIFRTVRATDIQTLQEETDITKEEARRLPYLKTGDVFISSAVVGRTMYARMRAADTMSPHTENPFDELTNRLIDETNLFFEEIKEYLPIDRNKLSFTASGLEEDGIRYGVEELKNRLDALVEQGYLIIDENPFEINYKLK